MRTLTVAGALLAALWGSTAHAYDTDPTAPYAGCVRYSVDYVVCGTLLPVVGTLPACATWWSTDDLPVTLDAQAPMRTLP